MSKFSVRVELRHSESADYDKLHEKMEANGFSRTVTITSTGVVKYLPSAEYSYESENKTPAQVGELAESIALQVKPNPKIMVTKSAGRYYANLDKG